MFFIILIAATILVGIAVDTIITVHYRKKLINKVNSTFSMQIEKTRKAIKRASKHV